MSYNFKNVNTIVTASTIPYQKLYTCPSNKSAVITYITSVNTYYENFNLLNMLFVSDSNGRYGVSEGALWTSASIDMLGGNKIIVNPNASLYFLTTFSCSVSIGIIEYE